MLASDSKAQKLRGILSVTVLQATDLPKADWVGQNDNYVVCSLNKVPCDPHSNKNQQTECCQCTQVQPGTHPIWNEKLAFSVPQSLDVLYVQLWDEDYDKHDLVAEGKFHFDKTSVNLTTTWLQEQWIDLTTQKGEQAGRIRVVLHFTPQSAVEYLSKKFNETQAQIKAKVTQAVVSKFADAAAGQIKGYFS